MSTQFVLDAWALLTMRQRKEPAASRAQFPMPMPLPRLSPGNTMPFLS